MKLLVHASGYKTVPAYASDHQEIMAMQPKECGGSPNVHWSPASKDFAAVGVSSGGSSPAASIDDLLNVISQQGVETIEELRIIGHANAENFVLAGEVRRDDVYFTQDNALIGPSSDAFKAALPRCRDLQDRFARDAKIVLLGCNAGSGKDAIMSIVSHAFLRTVQGLKEEIIYNPQWGPAGAEVKSGDRLVCTMALPNSRVLSRNRMMYSPAAAALGDIFGQSSNAALFRTNAWLMEPDASNNDGDVMIALRRTDAGTAASELFWRLLKEFFPNHAWIAGSGVDTALSGIRVRKNNGFLVDVGPDFAKKTSPKTLKNRVAEIGKALDLVKAAKEGVIPLT